MFRSRNDALARQVDFETEVWDFFDLSSLWEKQEKVLGSGMVGTGALILGGRALGGISWLDSTLTAAKIVGPNNMRRLLLPGLITAGKLHPLSLKPHPSILTSLSQPSS